MAFLFLLTSAAAWGCLSPSSEELTQFFEGSPFWTEVQDKKSFELAKKRPVFLLISFTDPSGTRIRWGDNAIKGNDISLCWKTFRRKKIVIHKGFFKTTLVKVEKGLLKSWIPFDGDLYYRNDKEVKRPSKQRELAEEK